MTKDRRYILGRVVDQTKGMTRIRPFHGEAVLIHQQKIQALTQVATEFAHDPSDEHLADLIHVAMSFGENR